MVDFSSSNLNLEMFLSIASKLAISCGLRFYSLLPVNIVRFYASDLSLQFWFAFELAIMTSGS